MEQRKALEYSRGPRQTKTEVGVQLKVLDTNGKAQSFGKQNLRSVFGLFNSLSTLMSSLAWAQRWRCNALATVEGQAKMKR